MCGEGAEPVYEYLTAADSHWAKSTYLVHSIPQRPRAQPNKQARTLPTTGVDESGCTNVAFNTRLCCEKECHYQTTTTSRTLQCKMNGFYVTVSIPLLLVLAGFNHAHGLTTFGKTGNQQSNANIPNVVKKPCANQQNCSLIKGTTCLDGFCYCGDNKSPVNGHCQALLKGPNHICTESSDCVEGATCVEKESSKQPIVPTLPNGNNVVLTCQCIDGAPTPNGHCSGAAMISFFSGLVFVLAALTRAYEY